ncbi:hypothetical protein JXQ70_20425 [bacterium]|nr:hypothetical protein [bacterium]
MTFIKEARVRKLLQENKIPVLPGGNDTSSDEDFDRVQEFVIGFSIDQMFTQPVMYFSTDRALIAKWGWDKERDGIALMAIDLLRGVRDYQARDLVRRCKIAPELANKLVPLILRFYQLCRRNDIVRGEIAPLVLTSDGRLCASNAELVIDEHALFRNQQLQEDVVRDRIFSAARPPLELEKTIIDFDMRTEDWGELVPWISTRDVPESTIPVFLLTLDDELATCFIKEALARENIVVTHLCLLKGNISASKVFQVFHLFLKTARAAGFFVSGLGFSSQDQLTIARGLMKAFRYDNLSIPGVVRFDSNNEQQAIETIRAHCWDLPAIVEPYSKDNSLHFCIKRLRLILEEKKIRKLMVDPLGNREQVIESYVIETRTGRIIFDHKKCQTCDTKICISSCPVHILTETGDLPVLSIESEKARNSGCIECLACEFMCWSEAKKAIDIDLPTLI